jgi:outer membrane protein OmpA-like peptidoglycan-associated protein
MRLRSVTLDRPARARALCGLASILAITLAASSARAQTGGNIELNRFRSAMDSRGYITVNASQILGHKEVSFGLVLNWGHKVLELEGDDWGMTPQYADGKSAYTVENIITPELIAAFGLFKVVELGVSVPFNIVSGDIGPDFVGDSADPQDDDNFDFSAQGVGDIGVHAKIRFLNTSRHPVGLAVIASAYIPPGYDKLKWLGDGDLTFRPMLVIDKEFGRGRLKLAGNVGIKIRTGDSNLYEDNANATMEDPGDPEVPFTGESIEAKTEIPWGAGIAYAVSPQKFDLVAEVFGSVPLGGENYLPLEAIGGIKVYLARNSFLTLGGGAGLLPGASGGNPDIRGFVGIIFEPNIGDKDGDGIKDDLDQCPLEPEDFDDFQDSDGCPEPDNDKDGLLDEVDKCPNEPEDKDGIEDEDGCPDEDDLDRDNDGIKDDVDQCPDDPEDRDEFQDEDGCPDPDNDDDGILDVDDVCINDPEDKDDFEDQNGCPDPDNDKDRILDKADKCPNDPENYNGNEDEDGCPDRGRVIVNQSNIEILDKIYFETDKAIIKPESYPILDAIAATLQGNPDILLIEIQGHADERGDDDHNDKLTDDRAHSVMNYLVDKGVEKERLRAKGYGERKPIDPGHNENAWSKNRRVEFIILKRANQP